MQARVLDHVPVVFGDKEKDFIILRTVWRFQSVRPRRLGWRDKLSRRRRALKDSLIYWRIHSRRRLDPFLPKCRLQRANADIHPVATSLFHLYCPWLFLWTLSWSVSALLFTPSSQLSRLCTPSETRRQETRATTDWERAAELDQAYQRCETGGSRGRDWCGCCRLPPFLKDDEEYLLVLDGGGVWHVNPHCSDGW